MWPLTWAQIFFCLNSESKVWSLHNMLKREQNSFETYLELGIRHKPALELIKRKLTLWIFKHFFQYFIMSCVNELKLLHCTLFSILKILTVSWCSYPILDKTWNTSYLLIKSLFKLIWFAYSIFFFSFKLLLFETLERF